MFVVSASALRELVPMRDAIDAVEQAFVSIADGSARQPPRLVSNDGSALAMLAQGPNGGPDGGTVFKVVSVWERNRLRNLSTVHALAIWLDEETHRPHLLIEGASLTALRTGAATGVATRLLAAPSASILAVIGAGGQAADQIRGVCAVRLITDVRIYSRTEITADCLVEQMTPELPGVRLRRASSASEAVDGADVICSATSSSSPVLPAEAITDRVHINAIGSYRHDMCEIPRSLLASAEVIAVDSLEASLAEAGEIIDAVESGAVSRKSIVEIGTLVVQPPTELRAHTIFKSVGLAVQDWAICKLLDDRWTADAPTIDL